jgi:hypothetical protein
VGIVMPPAITSVANAQGVAEGLPGDPVIINGTGFGGLPPLEGGGTRSIFNGYWVELAFDNAPASIGNSRVVPNLSWNDTQIVVVPQIFLQGYAAPLAGRIVVHRGDGAASQPAAFTLQPAIDVFPIGLPPRIVDSSVHFPSSFYSNPSNVSALPTDTGTPDGWNKNIGEYSGWGISNGVTFWFGDKGYDEFFMTRQLAPGFSVVSAEVTVINVYVCGLGCVRLSGTDPQSAGYAGAYVLETGGSTRPYLKVHTWQNPLTSLDYTIKVLLRGPRGVQPFVQ